MAAARKLGFFTAGAWQGLSDEDVAAKVASAVKTPDVTSWEGRRHVLRQDESRYLYVLGETVGSAQAEYEDLFRAMAHISRGALAVGAFRATFTPDKMLAIEVELNGTLTNIVIERWSKLGYFTLQQHLHPHMRSPMRFRVLRGEDHDFDLLASPDSEVPALKSLGLPIFEDPSPSTVPILGGTNGTPS